MPYLSSERVDVLQVPLAEQDEGQDVRDDGVGRLGVGALVHGLQGGPQLRLETEGRVREFLPHHVPSCCKSSDLQKNNLN